MRYLYIVNYAPNEEELANLELKSLFSSMAIKRGVISTREINPTISPFIKKRVDILVEARTKEELLKKVEELKLVQEENKVEYIKLKDEKLNYESRLSLVKELGMKIAGRFNARAPKVIFGVVNYNESWYFGKLVKNSFKWREHINKPLSYSNSMPVQLAKVVVNLASEGDKSKKILDPCCGIGTTILEGISVEYNISGSDINEKVIDDGNKNLAHYGWQELLKKRDFFTIEENYDSTIIDIPYGVFSHTSRELQFKLIEKARKISERLILISFENLDDLIEKAGFQIEEKAYLKKRKFSREVVVCNRRGVEND